MKTFWVSWYDHLYGKWEWHGPWWVSGYRLSDDAGIVCAAVSAKSEQAAREAIFEAHDERPADLDFRFVEERDCDWNPLANDGGRFPPRNWMRWPMTSEQNKKCISEGY